MDSKGKSLTRISLEGSALKVSDGKYLYNLGKITSKSWSMVKIVIDTNKDTCKVYVNGKLKKSNLKLMYATTNVGKVKYEIPGSLKGVAYIDNVKIYK